MDGGGQGLLSSPLELRVSLGGCSLRSRPLPSAAPAAAVVKMLLIPPTTETLPGVGTGTVMAVGGGGGHGGPG